METIKKYLISFGISFGLILIFSFFLNLFNYFDLFNPKIYKVVLILLVGTSIFIGSFLLGKKSNEKGYLEGIKYGLISCLLMFFISFLAFSTKFNIDSLIYYLILIIISIIASIAGINRKTNES